MVFALGFVDCACFHNIEAVCAERLSVRQLAECTALYFYRNVYTRTRPVREVFCEQVPRASCASRKYNGEVFEGPHGFCVSEFRQKAFYDSAAETAFLIGYLECFRHVVKGAVEFFGSANEEAKKIDEWYGSDESQDTIRSGTKDVPIADVLMHFAIPKGPSKPKNEKNEFVRGPTGRLNLGFWVSDRVGLCPVGRRHIPEASEFAVRADSRGRHGSGDGGR